MIKSEDSKDYIDDLKREIRKEVMTGQESECIDKSTQKQTNYNSSILTEEDNFYISLTKAEHNAKIGLTVPSFDKLFFLRRIFLRWVAKFLFKILKVITINQREYNLSILDAIRGSINSHINLRLRLAEVSNRLINNLVEQNMKLKEQKNKISELTEIINYLKACQFQLERKIENFSKSISRDVFKKIGRGRLQNVISGDKHYLDPIYVFLENHLRGEREDVKNRLKFYLPFIKGVKAGSKESPILDIGCGRGEWLELLKENNLNARGLDLNQIMVKMCKERGFEVIESEALSFLKNLSDCSLGAVTGFHIIEHYGFEFLIKLLVEILRVLKPGGLVIFETPNPNNVLVGSCNFYLDPTHFKPLPSHLIKLVLESRGFNDVNIIYLHPYEDDFKIKDNGSEISKQFNDYFYGPQDYAVVGYKI